MCAHVSPLFTLRGGAQAPRRSGEVIASRVGRKKKTSSTSFSDSFALLHFKHSPRHRRGVPLVAARVLAKVDLLLPLFEPARVGLLLLGGVGADGGRGWSVFFFSRKKGGGLERVRQLKKKKIKIDGCRRRRAFSLSLHFPLPLPHREQRPRRRQRSRRWCPWLPQWRGRAVWTPSLRTLLLLSSSLKAS